MPSHVQFAVILVVSSYITVPDAGLKVHSEVTSCVEPSEKVAVTTMPVRSMFSTALYVVYVGGDVISIPVGNIVLPAPAFVLPII